MSQIRVLLTESNNPYLNLATEDWIFNDMPPEGRVLFLWRNEPSIIVGRGQNVWSECLTEQVEKDGVHLVRRHSGGGAVYQDLGNTCFTFMRPRESARSTRELYAENNQILIRALGRLGVKAEASGRNDLVVEHSGETFKISGSAFKENKDRCFHHGTMLLKVDLQRLAGYLTPDSKKLQAKGIKSVRARVMNLTEAVPDLEHTALSEALIEEFFSFYGARGEIEILNQEKLLAIDSLSAYHSKLKSWDWIYGKTPSFAQTMRERFEWGGCELHLDTNKGVITEAVLYTDSLFPEVFDPLPSLLKNRPYSLGGLLQARDLHLRKLPTQDRILHELYQWIGSQIV
ncbi:MAG: lipoate--protein ligase [Vulcanimicrobiota bacterium]